MANWDENMESLDLTSLWLPNMFGYAKGGHGYHLTALASKICFIVTISTVIFFIFNLKEF